MSLILQRNNVSEQICKAQASFTYQSITSPGNQFGAIYTTVDLAKLPTTWKFSLPHTLLLT